MKKKKSNELPKKRPGCLLLIFSAIVFIALVYGIIIACMTLPDKVKARENSLLQVNSCKSDGKTEGDDEIQKYYDNESCEEMIKQHTSRFKEEK
ncbi:hypothetical protein [Pantoea sp. App145]|uniref:hypothetical protein n=1 Tax=Pantoea sp. App145 TaxID=3071567 RepID=UPI003A80C2C6